jgi:hypothetical protein
MGAIPPIIPPLIAPAPPIIGLGIIAGDWATGVADKVSKPNMSMPLLDRDGGFDPDPTDPVLLVSKSNNPPAAATAVAVAVGIVSVLVPIKSVRFSDELLAGCAAVALEAGTSSKLAKSTRFSVGRGGKGGGADTKDDEGCCPLDDAEVEGPCPPGKAIRLTLDSNVPSFSGIVCELSVASIHTSWEPTVVWKRK